MAITTASHAQRSQRTLNPFQEHPTAYHPIPNRPQNLIRNVSVWRLLPLVHELTPGPHSVGPNHRRLLEQGNRKAHPLRPFPLPSVDLRQRQTQRRSRQSLRQTRQNLNNRHRHEIPRDERQPNRRILHHGL